jgi:hypothetical protein
MRNKTSPTRVNKKKSVEVDSAATTSVQGKLTYFMDFPWLLVKAAP